MNFVWWATLPQMTLHVNWVSTHFMNLFWCWVSPISCCSARVGMRWVTLKMFVEDGWMKAYTSVQVCVCVSDGEREGGSEIKCLRDTQGKLPAVLQVVCKLCSEWFEYYISSDMLIAVTSSTKYLKTGIMLWVSTNMINRKYSTKNPLFI